MKQIFAVVIGAVLFTGCVSENSAGRCVGITEAKAPGKAYSVSGRNLIVGLLFSETVLVPGYILLKEFECPVEP